MKIFLPVNRTIGLLLTMAIGMPALVFGQLKPEYNSSKEIISANITESKIVGNKRVEKTTNKPLVIYSPDYTVSKAEPMQMAKQYLTENISMLQLKNDLSELEFVRTIETPGGHKVQFIQVAEGFPVYGSTVKVSIDRNNQVVFVTNSTVDFKNIKTNIKVKGADAIGISKNYLGISGKLVSEKFETVVFNTERAEGVIAHKVNIVPAESNFGDWELIVDATSGTILRAEDRACYHTPYADTVKGSGWVFDPDPVTNSAGKYGVDGIEDNNDEATDSVLAQVKEVELRDIKFEDGMYKLEGPNAVIVDVESPWTGLHEQDSANFHHPRSERPFEATQIYYHVDHSMRYINDSLGFTVVPFQYEGGVQFDPHGFDDIVNAHYVRSEGYISFGSPPNNVDLGEDNAVVLHELGHGIHDWITNGGISQVNGLSEGISDYWAQSYSRSLNKYQPGDEGYDWFGVWGGQPWGNNPSLRVTNSDSHFPEDLVGQVHTDGMMWSSSMMSIYDEVGRYVSDVIHWEGISMLDGNSGQVDAAIAVIQADKNLFDGEHLDPIIEIFTARGYISGPFFIGFGADVTGGEGPLTVNFTDESVSYLGDIVSWEWDFDGDGIIDSEEQNPSHTYTEVGSYTVGLRISDGENTTSLVKPNYITVNGGFYVFETEENMRDHSGAFHRDFLTEHGFDVVYSYNFPSSFEGFEAAFISLGNYNSNETPLSDAMADALIDFLQQGGKVYLESGDALGYYQSNNQTLLGLFGLSDSEDGSTNGIDLLSGNENALTESMAFTSSNQTAFGYIDKFTPDEGAGAMAAFEESDYGTVAVQHTGLEHGQQTFCFSYAMAELSDVDPKSSKYNLMIRIMEFFGYPIGKAGLVANFVADKSSVLPEEEIQFTDWTISDTSNPVNAWEWDFDGDGTIDSYEQNPVYAFPKGGMFDVTLIASNDATSDTLTKKDFIAVRSGIFVFEGKANLSGYSGSFINNFLHENAYEEISYITSFPTTLDGYDVVLLSFGNSGNQATDLTSEMVDAINTFANEEGRIYLEGSDALSQNSTLWGTFGLGEVAAGLPNQLSDLMGNDDALTYGLEFEGSDQFASNTIDIYTPIPETGIMSAFDESDYGTVAVQLEALPEGRRTFCFSYALGDLQDGDGMNTRDELLLRILNFFDIVSDVDENISETSAISIKVFPNPSKDQVTLQFELKEKGKIDVVLNDLSGRSISMKSLVADKGKQKLSYNIQNLPAGVYYFNLRSEKYNESIKWLKVD